MLAAITLHNEAHLLELFDRQHQLWVAESRPHHDGGAGIQHLARYDLLLHAFVAGNQVLRCKRRANSKKVSYMHTHIV